MWKLEIERVNNGYILKGLFENNEEITSSVINELDTEFGELEKIVDTAWQKASTLRSPPAVRNFIRFRLARLHAELSRNMYSLHGFDALMRPEFGQVCQVLIVVSNWMPGSPQMWAASAILRDRSRA